MMLLPSEQCTISRCRASAVTQAAPRPPWNLAFCPKITIEHHLRHARVRKYVLLRRMASTAVTSRG